MVDKKISQLTPAPTLPLNPDTQVEIAVPDISSPTGYSTFRTPITDLSKKVVQIPNLQLGLSMGRHDEQNTIPKIRAYFNPCDTEFLNHNPQIWLFRFKKSKGKRVNGFFRVKDSRLRKSHNHFCHTVHQNGVNFPGSNLYGGKIQDAGGTDLPGRDTEFGCPTQFYETLELGVNPDQWVSSPLSYPFTLNIPTYGDRFVSNAYFYGVAAKDNSLPVPPYSPGKLNKGPRSLVFCFAIVIDNPDTTSPYKKLIGPMSDIVVYFPQYIKSGDPNEFRYIKWSVKRSSQLGKFRYVP